MIETLLSEGYNVQLKHSPDESQATLGNVSLKTTDGVTLSTFPGFQGNRFVRDMPRNAAKLVAEALCKLEEATPTLPAPSGSPTGGAPSECAAQSTCCPDKSAAEKAECCGKKFGEEAAVEEMPARMKAAAERKAAEGGGCCTKEGGCAKAEAKSKGKSEGKSEGKSSGGCCAKMGGCADGECCFSMVQLVLVGLVLVLAAGLYHYFSSMQTSDATVPADKVLPEGLVEGAAKVAHEAVQGVAQAAEAAESVTEAVASEAA